MCVRPCWKHPVTKLASSLATKLRLPGWVSSASYKHTVVAVTLLLLHSTDDLFSIRLKLVIVRLPIYIMSQMNTSALYQLQGIVFHMECVSLRLYHENNNIIIYSTPMAEFVHATDLNRSLCASIIISYVGVANSSTPIDVLPNRG